MYQSLLNYLLSFFVYHNCILVVSCLLRLGAEVNHKDRKGLQPLDYVRDVYIRDLLVSKGAYKEGYFLQHNAARYEMSALRKWKWVANLIHLGYFKQQRLIIQNGQYAELFSKPGLSNEYDECLKPKYNLIPQVSVQSYISEGNFKDYCDMLAKDRHYVLFANVLFRLLRLNGIETEYFLGTLNLLINKLKEDLEDEYLLAYIPKKSQQWLASLFLRVVDRKPIDCIEKGKINRSLPCKKIFMLDDICYTGIQARDFINDIANKVFFRYKHLDALELNMAFVFMSSEGLHSVIKHAKCYTLDNSGITVKIHYGSIIPSAHEMLSMLPYPPMDNEYGIMSELLSGDHTPSFDVRESTKILTTTAWKRPDFISSFFSFVGNDGKYLCMTSVSEELLDKHPAEPMMRKLCSSEDRAHNMRPLVIGPNSAPYRPA